MRLNNLISLRKDTVLFFHFDNEPTALTVVVSFGWRLIPRLCYTLCCRVAKLVFFFPQSTGRARNFPGVHLFLSLTVQGGGRPEVGGVTRLGGITRSGGVRKEPSSTCNLTTRLTREQEKCWQTTCFGFSALTCCSCCNFQSCCFLLLIKLKWEIIWTGGLPHLPGVPHLHEKRP